VFLFWVVNFVALRQPDMTYQPTSLVSPVHHRKGEMTTFFVEVGMGARSSLNSRSRSFANTIQTDDYEDEYDETIRDFETSRRLSFSSMGWSQRRSGNSGEQEFHHDYGEQEQHPPVDRLPEDQPKPTIRFNIRAAGQTIADRLGISDEISI
jgi:hypothetical protein